MFNFIGKKIKALSWVLFIIGILYSIFSGIAFIYTSLTSVATFNSLSNIEVQDSATSVLVIILMVIVGILIMAIGSIVSWISVFCLYGFGEIVDKITDMREDLHKLRKTYIKVNEKKTQNYKCTHCGAEITYGTEICPDCNQLLNWEKH